LSAPLPSASGKSTNAVGAIGSTPFPARRLLADELGCTRFYGADLGPRCGSTIPLAHPAQERSRQSAWCHRLEPDGSGPLAGLFRGERGNRQGMDVGAHEVGERSENHALTLEPALAREHRCHN
jgi:hypothetical protein